MVTTKTTALLVAMTLIGAAPTAINAFADNVQVVNQEDNDKVKQKNEAKVEQNAANVDGGDFIDVGDQTNTQTAVVAQSNTNNDNDAQIAVASIDDRDACGILVAFGIDC
jgi:hypothetical protein